MNEPGPPPARPHGRVIALALAALCLLALAAGTFVLSYPATRAVTVNAGVAPNFARVYPGILGAVLLVACAAALSLRRVWRFFAWLVVLVVIGALAAADTTHVLSIALPKRPMEVTAAVVPWAALVIGLLLLDAMARQNRPGRNAVPTGYAAGPGLAVAADRPRPGSQPAPGAATVPLSALLAVSRPAAPAASPPPPHWAGAPVTQPGARPDPHPFQPTARFTTPPADQQVTPPTARQATPPIAQPVRRQAGPQGGQPAESSQAGPAKSQQPVTDGPAGAKPAHPQQPEAANPAEPEPGKPSQPDASKPPPAEATNPPGPMAGEPAGPEPGKPERAESQPGQPQQSEAGKPAEAEPPQPSDADAEPAGNSTPFSWLRRSRAAPGETSANGTPTPSKESAASSSTATDS